jgi:hypothetical protein
LRAISASNGGLRASSSRRVVSLYITIDDRRDVALECFQSPWSAGVAHGRTVSLFEADYQAEYV